MKKDNIIFLVSKTVTSASKGLERFNKAHYSYDTAKAHFETLVNDYKIDAIMRHSCKREEIYEYIEVTEDMKELWSCIDDCCEEEVEIQVEKLEVY